METNKDAWAILNKDEQTALTLSLGFSKSTWEAGQVMNKAHFKYLEIQKRARKFLEIFTNHLEKYGGLFPEGVNISFAFKEYLQLTVLSRNNISTAVRAMESPNYSVASFRNRLILKEIEKLSNDTSEEANDLYNLIMDFDRWNNFRILPMEAQEPSAFKRRNKSRNVKHLRNITTLPQFSVIKIIERYGYSGKYEKAYLPMVSEYLDGELKVVQIKNDMRIINQITEIGLFVFKDKVKAMDFAKLISSYFIGSIKNCKTGQRFWPEFRILMTFAINHKELENIHKSRTYLDKAIFDYDPAKVKLKHKEELRGELRGDDNLFYPEG